MMRLIGALLVVSVLVLGGCQVYTNLYGNPSENASAVYVPDSSIVVENGLGTKDANETESVEEMGEEARALAANIQKKIDEKAMADQALAGENEQSFSVDEAAAAEKSPDVSPLSREDAIIKQETDFISIAPSAEDPDGDSVTFAFTSPLNEKGQWQTTYGDAGEYTVTISASDGDLTSTQDILLIISKKEEAPAIGNFSPLESRVALRETEAKVFSVFGSDLNSDPLSYEWKLDGALVSEENAFEYRTTYDDAGTHQLEAKVTDGVSDASHSWEVQIDNLNRKPSLAKIAEINAREDETITIVADASDEDEDDLAYTISDNRFEGEEGTFSWKTNYASAGSFTVTITVSDGQESVSQDVLVTIANVNRKPVILDIIQEK